MTFNYFKSLVTINLQVLLIQEFSNYSFASLVRPELELHAQQFSQRKVISATCTGIK